MTQILELAYEEFKITMTNMLKKIEDDWTIWIKDGSFQQRINIYKELNDNFGTEKTTGK